jgi:hypothetical protein
MRRPANKQHASDKADFPRRKSGRAAFEADGRSIWEWQTATGVFERNVSAEQVAKLEDTNLSIVEDSIEPAGTSIYDSATITRAVAPRTAIAKPAPRTTVLSRLLKRFGRH